MKVDRTVNMTDKPLKDFRPGDTLYIQKMKSGFSYVYLCEFIKLDKGTVVAKILQAERDYDRKDGEIRARASSCYLWGKATRTDNDHCNWFFRGVNFPATDTQDFAA